MNEPEIKVQTSFDNVTQLYKINVAFIDLVSSHRVKQYLGELLDKVTKTALMERYSEIQKIVDEVIFSPETRQLVEKSIKDEIEKITQQTIKEMFGKK